jgi:pantoate--beta-alanine ligase
MARDLSMDIEIVGHPTVREEDGLAMSSRNTYLSREEREKALLISKSLKKAEQLFSDGQRDTSVLRNAVEEVLKQSEDIQQEYISINDAETLAPVNTVTHSAVLAIACRIGKTRLIDNTILSED